MPRGGARTPAKPGQKFGYWTVIKAERSGFWLCKCECGTRRPIPIVHLLRGNTRSCGCHGKDWCRKHGMEGTRPYWAWTNMIRRCHTPGSSGYAGYGARGITVCKRWRKSFAAFIADMGLPPGDGYSIGRKDNDDCYRPGNCSWQTVTEQNRNRSNTTFLTLAGETRALAEWAEIYGLRRRLVAERIRSGWSTEDALATPARPKSG